MKIESAQDVVVWLRKKYAADKTDLIWHDYAYAIARDIEREILDNALGQGRNK